MSDVCSTGKNISGEVHEGAPPWIRWKEQEPHHYYLRGNYLFWKDIINLIDTPGHIDFTIEVNALFVYSMAQLLFSVAVGLRRNQLAYTDEFKVPRLCLSKANRRRGFYADVASIHEHLKKMPFLFNCQVWKINFRNG